jgi:hypothetical protein
MKRSKIKRVSWFANAWQKIANWVGGILLLAGFALLGVQVFLYLLNEEWVEMPLLYLASYGSTEFSSWLDSPTSWLTLHQIVYGILNFISLPFALILAGILMVAYEAVAKSS